MKSGLGGWGFVLDRQFMQRKKKKLSSSPPTSVPVLVPVPIFDAVATADSEILQQPAKRAPAAE